MFYTVGDVNDDKVKSCEEKKKLERESVTTANKVNCYISGGVKRKSETTNMADDF